MPVYFLQAVNGGPVKIGCSYSALLRKQTIEREEGEELTILGLVDGNRDVEQALHIVFEDFRINDRGEWFTPDKTLLEFIETRTKPLIDGTSSISWSDLPDELYLDEAAILIGLGPNSLKGWFGSALPACALGNDKTGWNYYVRKEDLAFFVRTNRRVRAYCAGCLLDQIAPDTLQLSLKLAKGATTLDGTGLYDQRALDLMLEHQTREAVGQLLREAFANLENYDENPRLALLIERALDRWLATHKTELIAEIIKHSIG